MKHIKFTLAIVLFTLFYSCNNDDNKNKTAASINNMSAVINGIPITLEQSLLPDNIRHEPENHIQLKAWAVNPGSGAYIVDIYIDKNHTEPGLYPINTITSPDAPHYIYFNDNTNNETENTVTGFINIISFQADNTKPESITGTFSLITSDDATVENPIINYDIKNGQFSYTF